jgi:hypothetical protein
MPTLGDALAEVFSRYDPQRVVPKMGKPTNEDLWRARLSGQGSITKAPTTLGSILGDALSGAARKAGLSERQAQRVSKRAMAFAGDATPVGNALMAEEGGKQVKRGLTQGDLKQAAIGAGVLGLSMLPFAGKARKPLNSLMYDESGAIRYHGTTEIFDQFDPAKSNGLYFFSDSLDIAGIYGHRIKAADINFRNPMTVPQVADPAHIPALADKAKSAGHDGLVIESINDVGGPQRQFVAFDPPRLMNAPVNDATDAHSLAGLLSDPRPTHALYRPGDVLMLNGETAEVVGERGSSLLIRTPGGSRLIARDDPGLSVAPPDRW